MHRLAQLLLPLLVAYVHLVCVYYDSFFQPHCRYLKKVDSCSNLHGFNARNMPLHSYIMHRDFINISEHWNDMLRFKPFIYAFTKITNPSYTIYNLVRTFTNLVLDKYKKCFNQWWNKNLPLDIAGEPILATRLVCWFMNKPAPPLYQ